MIVRIRILFKKAEAPKGPLDLNEAIREVIVLTRNEMDFAAARVEVAWVEAAESKSPIPQPRKGRKPKVAAQ